MPTRGYALQPGEPERLEVSWKHRWRDLTVLLDGQIVGSFDPYAGLRRNKVLTLSDGSTLEVKLATGPLKGELVILRNGRPIPGSPSEADVRLRAAAGAVFIVAALGTASGLLGGLTGTPSPDQIARSIGLVVAGCAFVLLGYFIRRRSTAALVIAVVLYSLDAIAVVVIPRPGRSGPAFVPLVVHVCALLFMVKGFSAIRALRQEANDAPRGSKPE